MPAADRAPVTNTRRAHSSLIEPLESRLLMYRVNGSETFEYLAGDDETIVRVVVEDADVTFVFAAVDGKTNDVSLRTGFIAPPVGDEEERPGRDLFAVYVRTSDVDSYISVAAVPGVDDEDRPMLPYVESIGDLRVINAQDGDLEPVSAPAETGKVLLGARTRDLEDSDAENEDNIPIIQKRLDAGDRIGALAPDGNIVHAGLTVARDNDFGRFLFGGTVLGNVEFTGSVETFYAGWLLTGDAGGIFEGGTEDVNFYVAGDMRNLIVKSSIGTNADALDTEPAYLSGTNVKVRGRIGQVRAFDSIAAQIYAQHRDDAPSMRGQWEVEDRRITENSFTTFQQGRLGPDAIFQNDTFDTPQYLGTFANSGGKEIIRVDGELQNSDEMQDVADYYGVALLAGQTISVELEAFGLNVGIFDPDGRLVASDYDSFGRIVFTADRPGVHRIAVAVVGDADFGAGDEFETEELVSEYRLRVQGAGDMGIGAVAATNGLFARVGADVRSAYGDVGTIVADGSITAQRVVDRSNFRVQRGNLRSVEAGSIGYLIENEFGFGPMLDVSRGSVGLLRSTNAAGILVVNNLAANQVTPIGRDYQLVESASNFHGSLFANGNIGVIRAAQIATDTGRAFFKVNADERGPAGVIDLIDVAGDLGTISAGGPAIETGPGGNVRYINVGGDVYQDLFFGGGGGHETEFAQGERVDLIDDSGATVRLTPIPRDRNPNWDPTNPFSPQFLNPGALTISTYGIRDKGGVVLLNVSSTRGVQVDADGASVEIAQIDANGTGTAIVDRLVVGPGQPVNFDDLETELQFATTASSRALDVLLRGNAVVDVLNISGGQFTSIINSTRGEIVSADITSVGELRARTLGLTRSSTGAAVNPLDQKSNTYPFLDQRNAIQISGNAIDISAQDGLGNLIVGGIVQRMSANADRSDTRSAFEGINAPVQITGELRDINIGEGILYSGAGNLAHAGLFVNGQIADINGNNADIRGDVISNIGIGRISLHNGSIINTDIQVISDFADAREFGLVATTPSNGQGTFVDPVYELGGINISGNGGIIGANIGAYDIGPIYVAPSGFGILNTSIGTPGVGQIASVTAGGYGIRSVSINGGANMQSMTATGNGELLSTRNYSKSVRTSERARIDPLLGSAPSPNSDLHEFLGTSKDRHRIKNVSKSGVMENVDVRFGRTVGSIDAHVIRGNSSFSVANNINSFQTRSGANRMTVRTGRLSNLSIGGNARNTDIRVAGPLNQGTIKGDMDAASSISATGTDGIIGNLSIGGDASGSIRASVRINTLKVGRSLKGPVEVDGTRRDATAIQNLTVGRDFTGTIDVLGKVKSIEVGRDFGRGNSTARITGELEELIVGRHFDASLRVRRDLGTLDIDNSVLSGSVITVDNDLDELIIGDNLEAGAVITVGGTLGSRSVGGQTDGDIIVG